MSDKSTDYFPAEQVHRIPAGIHVGDRRTELFGDRETRKVYALSNGATIPFINLDPDKRAVIFEHMVSDDVAMADLRHLPHDEALEQFAFCVYGAADSEPDFDEQGNLGKADNFICGNNCICLKWPSKQITLNGNPLTPRQVEVVRLLASDKADKQIAELLGISESTLDTHKRHIYEKAGVNSRPGLVVIAITDKVIQ